MAPQWIEEKARRFWTWWSGNGFWRAGCGRCEWRADFATKAQAQKAADEHDAIHHSLRWPGADVYPSTPLVRLRDWAADQEQALAAAFESLSGELGTAQNTETPRAALAELISRRGLERACEVLVGWAREAQNSSVALEIIEAIRRANIRWSGGHWRAGCDRCRWRVDFATQAYARRAAQQHASDPQHVDGWHSVMVYPSTPWARFRDWFLDEPQARVPWCLRPSTTANAPPGSSCWPSQRGRSDESSRTGVDQGSYRLALGLPI